jgi:hypothetical protein
MRHEPEKFTNFSVGTFIQFWTYETRSEKDT